MFGEQEGILPEKVTKKSENKRRLGYRQSKMAKQTKNKHQLEAIRRTARERSDPRTRELVVKQIRESTSGQV